LFISSEHLNKKRLAPDAARSMAKKRGQKRWSTNGKTGRPGIGGVGGVGEKRAGANHASAACRAGKPMVGRTALKR
jgi:hypothetical protein